MTSFFFNIFVNSLSNIFQAKWDDASKVKIKVSTKPCPKCRTATERDGKFNKLLHLKFS